MNCCCINVDGAVSAAAAAVGVVAVQFCYSAAILAAAAVDGGVAAVETAVQ